MGNIHLVTGYAGTEHVTSSDQGAFHVAMFGNKEGVLDAGNRLAASIVTNNQVRVLDGEIYMQGRYIRLAPDTYVDLTIENGTQATYRNDLIVARYTCNSGTAVEEANLVVITGTAAESSPVDPAYTTGDIRGGALQNDIPLYRVVLDGLTVTELVPLFSVIHAKQDAIEFLDTEDGIEDGDFFPMHDISDGEGKKVLWSTVKEVLDIDGKATTATYTASVGTSWAEDTTNGGYTQTVSVDGILATDVPIADVVLGEDVDANSLYLEAWGYVTRITTAAGSITLWANSGAPTSAFTVQLKVVR